MGIRRVKVGGGANGGDDGGIPGVHPWPVIKIPDMDDPVKDAAEKIWDAGKFDPLFKVDKPISQIISESFSNAQEIQ